ncbi:hypothetical protein SAMN06296386_104246 [Lachnospiraceae bacterium]|nr:hypothetical protein SAMN06296386_104246 [Lachnospiraceae bacterium]
MGARDFLGSGWKFPLQIDPRTGKMAVSDMEDNIRESIGIILSTYRGERVMRPDFGATTADFVFTPTSYTEKETISYELSRQLLLDEPRITDVTVDCTETGIEGALKISVSYTVRSTNNRYNQVYPFYLDEEMT